MNHPTDTLHISLDTKRMVFSVLLATVFSLVSGASALHFIRGPIRGSFSEFVMDLAALLFAICAMVWLYRVVTLGGGKPVVSLSKEGLRDVRLSADIVPWKAVRGISVAQVRRHKYVVLEIDPAVAAGLAFRPTARWALGLNYSLGIKGVCVVTQGINVEHQKLLEKVREYSSAAWARETE